MKTFELDATLSPRVLEPGSRNEQPGRGIGSTVWLEDLTRDSPAAAGGKAAGLGELLRAGLPVPPGFVVATSAYRAHIDHAHLRDRIRERLQALAADDPAGAEAAAAEIRGWIETAEMPADVRTDIATAYRALARRGNGPDGEPPVAVRSSATAEDLPDASFAGQQDTLLDVRGEAAVLAAVRQCWASLFGARALSYRARMGFAHLDVSLAVIIQVMVPAEVAGVMFTANPVTGAEDELIVSASYGLGELVVSGLVTPDTFVLNRRGKVRSRTPGSKQHRLVPAGREAHLEPVPLGDRIRFCITDEQLRALVQLGHRATRHFGTPQDLEWALAGGHLYILQSRPITTLVRRPAASLLRHVWDRALAKYALADFTEHVPDAPRPFDFAVLELSVDGLSSLLAELGVVLAPAASFTEELPNGRMLFRPSPPRLSASVLWRLPRLLVRALREDPAEVWAPLGREFQRDVDAVCQPAVEGLGTAALAGVMEAAISVCRRYLPLRFKGLFAAGGIHTALVHFWVRRAVGRAAAATRTRELYLALPYSTASMNRDARELARIALAHGRGDEFKAALDGFLACWGNRPVRGVVALPSVATWREEPGAVMGLVDTLVRDPAALDVAALEERQRGEFNAAREAVMRGLGRLGRRCFAASLRRARGYVLAREGDFPAFERAIAQLRRAARELGSRLSASGVIAARDDIFFVRVEEVTPLVSGKLPDVRVRIERRRRAYEQIVAACAHGESWLTASGSLPAPRPLPASGVGPDQLVGFPASPGRASGRVCIIRSIADFGKLKHGDVLVTPVTAPAWTPLFALAAAVVTEVGGPLSHAAIVAREYGIPAVLAVKEVTRLLEEDSRVVVDGNAGFVQRETAAHD